MKYMSGIEVMEGDVIVSHHNGESVEGVVLKVLLPNTEDARDWASPNGGVLIEGGHLGLAVHKSLEDDEDIDFVRRAAGTISS